MLAGSGEGPFYVRPARRIVPACVLRCALFGRRGAGVRHGGGAGDRAGLGAAVHIEGDLALEHQRAFDHGVRSDHYARVAIVHREQLPVGLGVANAALHVRVGADGDVAVDCFDAAGDLGADQADGAVHGLDVAADDAAAIDVDAAVDGFNALGEAAVGANLDAAVDRGQAAGLHVLGDGDAAVDGLGIAGACARSDAD